MNPRRAALGAVVAVGLVGLVAVSRDEVAVGEASFASLGAPTMPFVPTGSFITSSWFCGGVPAGEDDVGGQVVVTNPSEAPKEGNITVMSSGDGVAAVSRPFSIEARSVQTIDLRELQPSGSFLSALVEIEGGGGFVEQIARHPAGDSVSACANAASATWYFADGFSLADSTEQLVITNPYPDAAIVDIGFVTKDGERNPSRLQGYPIPGRSVRVVELGARDEAMIAARVESTRGRVVVARAQHYLGGGRLGYSVALGAPSLADQYYFADGEKAEGVNEQYLVFNASDQEVAVDVRFLGTPPSDAFLNDSELIVPAGRVLSFDTSTVEGLPDGRHGVVFSTFSTRSIVVERVVSRPAGQRVATTVVMGAPPGLASTRWSAAVGTDIALDDALVVLNADSLDTTVQVSTLGPGGLVPVPGLEAIPLPAGAVVTVPLTDPSVLGTSIVVTSAQRLFVERLLGRGGDLSGRSGSFALSG